MGRIAAAKKVDRRRTDYLREELSVHTYISDGNIGDEAEMKWAVHVERKGVRSFVIISRIPMNTRRIEGESQPTCNIV